MINTIIAAAARREFARSLRFEGDVARPLPRPAKEKPRLLYLHVPFCESLCPYCSFHRVLFQQDLCRRYFAALRRELVLYHQRGYDFQGIYVGGGTPTVMVDELAATIHQAKELFSIAEVSVETNPHHLTEGHLAVLRDAGVARLSVGVQSFHDGLLHDMGRLAKYGNGAEIAARLMAAKGLFTTLNADMIFNFPSQTEAMLKADLAVLITLDLDQITYYPLMVADATREAVARSLGRVDYRKEERFYNLILEGLQSRYRFSSAWCFSRKEAMIDEYIVDYEEYAGLGSGSIGFLEGVCYANTFDIAGYIAQIERNELPVAASRTFGLRELMRYDFLMKLFGTRLDLAFFRKKYGRSPWPYLWFDIAAFAAAGCFAKRNGLLELSKRGCYAWVILMREFFIAVNNFRDYCRRGKNI
ncbi:MAG: coproporphyrinogen III oxidase family protein [Syntrophales bacterium]|nr:coproporphyrinogen III oxidase family protein [Syntrophales bacterium]